MTQQDWNQRYLDGDIPWDNDEINAHLAWVIREHGIAPCAALEIGCGTGTNAVWLAGQGFSVTAADVAGEALQRARARAAAANAECRFVLGDATTLSFEGGPFAFAYDCGCLHSFREPEGRSALAANVARHLAPDGLWMSILGSADSAPRDDGPPQRSALDIVTAVEPCFELVELKAVSYRPEGDSFEAWRCVMRKRRER